MPSPIERAWRWLDDSLRSVNRELLEREGATPQGIRIIEFTLTVPGLPAGEDTTVALPYDATAEQVRQALQGGAA